MKDNLPAQDFKSQAHALALAAGLDEEKELQQQNAGLPSLIAIIKNDPGKSGLLVYSLGSDPTTGKEMCVKITNVQGIVADHINKRALFYNEKDGKCKTMWEDFPGAENMKAEALSSNKLGFPLCAAIGLLPTTEFKFATNCSICSFNAYGSPCRPKHNLLLSRFTAEDEKGQPLSDTAILLLPPTSMKYWMGKKGYLAGLKAQKISLLTVWTKFWTESKEGGGYDWFEIHMGMDRVVENKELVEQALAMRKASENEFKRLNLGEWQDPGDQPLHDEEQAF